MVEPTPPSALTIFATGAEAPGPIALDPYGMPGCSLFLSEIASELKLATPAGRATWTLAAPNDPGLAGAELAQQVLVLDAGANTAGAVMSSAGRFIVGIR